VLQMRYILGKTFLPLVLAQSALRVVILGIVYSHEIVFTQPMTSDNVCCGINVYFQNGEILLNFLLHFLNN
jgi:hypothetical protein